MRTRDVPHAIPVVYIDGTALPSGVDVVSILGGLSIEWGSDSVLDDPQPAKASFQLMWAGSVNADLLQIGLRVDISQTLGTTAYSIFSGRIESMRATRDGRGRLVVTLHCVDHLKELRSDYIATEWPNDDGTLARIDRLRHEFGLAGWSLSGTSYLPDAPLHAATYYSSITLYTLLRRYLCWWGPTVSFWDASSLDTGGVMSKRIEVGAIGSVTQGDVLTTDADGEWDVDYAAPDGAAEAILPARSVLADVDYVADPGARYTAARVQFQRTRLETYDDGLERMVTSLDAVQRLRPPEVLARYGSRVLEIESSALASPMEHRATGSRWLDFASADWRMGAVTVRRASHLPAETLARLLWTRDRRLTWWIINGVDVITPMGAVSTLRGAATGGTLTYDPLTGWEVSMHLTATRTAAPSDLPWTWLQGEPAAFSDAPTTRAGEVTFADFTTITETR